MDLGAELRSRVSGVGFRVWVLGCGVEGVGIGDRRTNAIASQVGTS